MLTQEEYMDVLKLHRQGFTIAEIADELGYHPATISRWIKDGGPPPARESDRSELVIDHFWSDRVKALLEANQRLLATSVFAIISAEGFEGSYPTVSRYVRALRGPRFRRADKASVPIETAPGEECQFDWSDCCDFGELFGLGELHCFGAILSWSRWRKWWFAASIDQNHTLEGLASFYEAAGGVPYFSRTDRMGALGTSRGRRFVLHPAVLDFARLHTRRWWSVLRLREGRAPGRRVLLLPRRCRLWRRLHQGVCTYFPYPATVWLNGHEWAKRQAARDGIAFTALSNGFGSCEDPSALQAICDRFGPADASASSTAGRR